MNSKYIFKKVFVAILVLVAMLSVCVFGVACDKNQETTQNEQEKPTENADYQINFSQDRAVFVLPKDASLLVQDQKKYYVNEKVEPISKEQKGDKVQYVFENSIKSSNKTFRIEKQGFITRAGYFAIDGEHNISLSKDENLYQNKQNTPSVSFDANDDLMLTNVGDNYFKTLQQNQVFDLKCYRAWQIVNDAIGNAIIEPNFEVEIISGDSVAITQKSCNNFEVKAVKSGVSEVRLKYQAISVLSGGKWKMYGANDKRREVVLHFGVGENFSCDLLKLSANNHSFDSEFDTVYFVNDFGRFEVEAGGVDTLYLNGKKVEKSLNTYELKIVEGANIIKVVAGDKTQFLTVYGKKIVVDGLKKSYQVGEKVVLTVQGLYSAVPKMSGLYNPAMEFSFGDTQTVGCRAKITFANGESVVAKYVDQFAYARKNNVIEFEVKSEYLSSDLSLDFSLSLFCEWWGYDLNAHRMITKDGLQGWVGETPTPREFGLFDLQ